MPGGAQLLAARGRAAVLPDDRIVQRLPRGGVPDAHGLALVGDSDRGQIAGSHPGIVERLACDPLRDRPDLARVVLNPARLGKVLGELAVGATDRLGLFVEHEAGRAGGALVDRKDHLGASLPPCEVHPHEIDQLAAAVREAGERAAGGAMGEVELDLGDAMPRACGVDAHPDLHAKAGRER